MLSGYMVIYYETTVSVKKFQQISPHYSWTLHGKIIITNSKTDLSRYHLRSLYSLCLSKSIFLGHHCLAPKTNYTCIIFNLGKKRCSLKLYTTVSNQMFNVFLDLNTNFLLLQWIVYPFLILYIIPRYFPWFFPPFSSQVQFCAFVRRSSPELISCPSVA